MARSSLPPVHLMHPTLAAKAFHHVNSVYEDKYDGWRMVAYKAGRAVIAVFDGALVSRFEWLSGRPGDETATPPIFMPSTASTRAGSASDR